MMLEEFLVKTDLTSRRIVFQEIEDLLMFARGCALCMGASFFVKFDPPKETVGEDLPLGHEGQGFGLLHQVGRG